MGKKRTILGYVLEGLIPYTEANLKLAFKPNVFFNELEKISGAKRQTLANTLSRAKRTGYVHQLNSIPVLTAAGKKKINFNARPPKVKKGNLMVIFDIPQAQAYTRDRFRAHLIIREFKLLQRSVWVSNYDWSNELKAIAEEMGISDFVEFIRYKHI